MTTANVVSKTGPKKHQRDLNIGDATRWYEVAAVGVGSEHLAFLRQVLDLTDTTTCRGLTGLARETLIKFALPVGNQYVDSCGTATHQLRATEDVVHLLHAAVEQHGAKVAGIEPDVATQTLGILCAARAVFEPLTLLNQG